MIEAEAFSGIGQIIKRETWDIFNQKYQQKFKQQYDEQIFTVVASVSLIDMQTGQHRIISVGFGTKSLPESVTLANKGECLLQDMHAQMLAIQGFKRFLLQEIAKKESIYLSWVEHKKKYKISDRFQVYLYCSQVFCGDCCISEEQESFSGAKPLKYLRSLEYPELKYQPNILRTKPGRLDLPIAKRSALLSCSDMIGLFNLVGIQGLELFSLITPVYLDAVILECSESLRSNICKGMDLVERLSQLTARSQSLICRQIFNIVIDNKERKISSQFRRNRPRLVILARQSTRQRQRDQDGFQLCGIISGKQFEWINGKTGLPEGSSLKTYLNKGKISTFSQHKLTTDFDCYREGEEAFKYRAIRDRLKILFGEWLDDTER